MNLYDDLIYKSKRIIVGKSEITSEHSVMFDGKVVLEHGFQIVYFDFVGKWFSVSKIRNM
jgi:predicted RNA-binding protein associated with RNAse of E/G family